MTTLKSKKLKKFVKVSEKYKFNSEGSYLPFPTKRVWDANGRLMDFAISFLSKKRVAQ